MVIDGGQASEKKEFTKTILRTLKYTQLTLILLLSIQLSGQTDKVKKFSLTFVGSYTWQGTHNIDFGLQPMLLLDAKKDHSNIGLVMTGNLLFYNGSTYFTPMTKLRIMPHKRKKFLHLAWFASVGHSYTNIQHKYDHRITPELGAKWERYNISVGYNIPVSAYRDNCTNAFRATFSFNLF
jgi:hypothetical protein